MLDADCECSRHAMCAKDLLADECGTGQRSLSPAPTTMLIQFPQDIRLEL